MSLDNAFTALDRAAWATVHEYTDGAQHGARLLAPLVGKNPATLCNEVNPAVTTHKLGLADAVMLMHATRDYRILQACAQTLHHLVIALPVFKPVSDVELLNKFAEWQSALGITCHVIKTAFENGALTAAELAAVRDAAQDHMQRFFEFLSRMETLVEDKP